MQDPRDNLNGRGVSGVGETNVIRMADRSSRNCENKRAPRTYVSPEALAKEKAHQLLRNYAISIANKKIETRDINTENLPLILNETSGYIEEALKTSEGIVALKRDLRNKIMPFYEISEKEFSIIAKKVFTGGIIVRNPQDIHRKAITDILKDDKNILIQVIFNVNNARVDIVNINKLAYANIDILYLKLKKKLTDVNQNALRLYLIEDRSC